MWITIYFIPLHSKINLIWLLEIHAEQQQLEWEESMENAVMGEKKMENKRGRAKNIEDKI